MASGSTIYRADVSIADMDRNYYADHALTIARHPSETEERLMVRLLAFAVFAADDLAFGRGISTDDEPDLWRRDLTGTIEQWIDVGLPDERDIRKACGRAREVIVYAYGGRAASLWWEKSRATLERQARLAVYEVPQEALGELARFADRTMRLQCTIQDGHVFVANGANAVNVELKLLKEGSQGRGRR